MWKGRYDVFRIKHCEAYGHHGKLIYIYLLKEKGPDANYFTE